MATATLAAQVTEALTRWNAQLDQLADWLSGDPAGGPNNDGRYPLTNALGATELFLSLPAVLNQVSSPASAAEIARAAADAAATLAQSERLAAEAAKDGAEVARDDAEQLQFLVSTQQLDVAAKWADVNFWFNEVSSAQASVVSAEATTLTYRDEVLSFRDEALVAQTAAELARDEAQVFASSIDPASFVTVADIQAEIDTLVSGAPGALDTLNELAAALGDDPNFASTVTAQIAGKANSSHGHSIADVSGLQTALNGKANSSHTHSISQVSGLQTALNGKANSSHTHSISQVSGLQTSLNAKLNLTGGTLSGTLATSGQIRIQATGPTQWWRDSDHRSFGIHVNSNLAYFMRGGVNGVSWDGQQINSRWPMVLDLNSGLLTLAGDLNAEDVTARASLSIPVHGNVGVKLTSLENRIAALEAGGVGGPPPF